MAGLTRIATALNPGDQVEVQYDYYDHVTIPVAVSVGAAGPQIAFGGSAPGQDDLFGSWVGPGFGNGGQAGDFRFFYTDIADQGLFRGGGVKFYLDTTWQLARTDVDVFAFGTGGAAALDVSAFLEARYGPYLVGRNGGGSEITSNVFTTTGGPEEIVAPRVTGGLNIIAVHAVRMNGTATEEPVAGRSALMNVNPAEVDIVTNRLAGSRDDVVSLSTARTCERGEGDEADNARRTWIHTRFTSGRPKRPDGFTSRTTRMMRSAVGRRSSSVNQSKSPYWLR